MLSAFGMIKSAKNVFAMAISRLIFQVIFRGVTWVGIWIMMPTNSSGYELILKLTDPLLRGLIWDF